MTAILEGIYKHGAIALDDIPVGLPEGRVRVIVIAPPTGPQRLLTFGKYPAGKMSTLEDFKEAEWRGEAEFDDTYGR